MDVINKSIRLERTGTLLKLGRSNNSLLQSESVSLECARITAYEKLSEADIVFKKRKSRVLGYISKGFRFRRVFRDFYEGQEKTRETQLEKKKKKKKKKKNKRSCSWLPDPDRRWPVQGW